MKTREAVAEIQFALCLTFDLIRTTQDRLRRNDRLLVHIQRALITDFRDLGQEPAQHLPELHV